MKYKHFEIINAAKDIDFAEKKVRNLHIYACACCLLGSETTSVRVGDVGALLAGHAVLPDLGILGRRCH